MTKRLWQLHSWLGLIAGIGLLVIGLTGSLLVFRIDLELLVNPDFERVDNRAAERKSLDELIGAVRRALPQSELTGWVIFTEPNLPDLAYVTRRGETESRLAFVNTCTGEIRGGGQKWNRTVSGWIYELHYSLFAGHLGVFVAGVFAVMLCFLGFTGLWLYRDFWKSFFKLRWRASRRIFFSDLHKTIGIASVAFNLILGFTGAYWNLPHAIGELVSGQESEPAVEGHFYNEGLSFDKLIEESEQKIPGFRVTYLSFPVKANEDIFVDGRASSNPFRSDYGSVVAFDAQTGRLKSASDIRQAGWWTQIADAFYPLHFGTFGGLFVKVIWCAGGLTPGLLAVSGFAIWWRRTRSRKTS